jgi:hypothetical protein
LRPVLPAVPRQVSKLRHRPYESLSVASAWFDTYLPASFLDVGRQILTYSRYSTIMSVAGDKDILTTAEWNPDDFVAFQRRLSSDLQLVSNAMNAISSAEADRLWKLAFGD